VWGSEEIGKFEDMGESREPLGYETPRERRAVVIERFVDGGATVTIHREPDEAIWPAVLLWGGLAVLCIVVWMRVATSVSGGQTALIVLGIPFLIWCVARIAVAAAPPMKKNSVMPAK